MLLSNWLLSRKLLRFPRWIKEALRTLRQTAFVPRSFGCNLAKSDFNQPVSIRKISAYLFYMRADTHLPLSPKGWKKYGHNGLCPLFIQSTPLSAVSVSKTPPIFPQFSCNFWQTFTQFRVFPRPIPKFWPTLLCSQTLWWYFKNSSSVQEHRKLCEHLSVKVNLRKIIVISNNDNDVN